jgi:peptidyl-tRNA hydrolase, PTH1 family
LRSSIIISYKLKLNRESKDMIIIIFLGNPGKKYSKNRHNIGFIIGEYFSTTHGIKVNQKQNSSIIGKGQIEGKEVILAAPQTYMNNSGIAVKELLNFFKSDTKNLIVIHDDIELPFPEYKIKIGGGHKGQNGIRSIIQQTNNPDFNRLRFGIGRPCHPEVSISDFVLSDFTKEEQEKIKMLLPDINTTICNLIKSMED